MGLNRNESGLVQSIRLDAPRPWAAFTRAAGHGLIFIDGANDAITAPNRQETDK